MSESLTFPGSLVAIRPVGGLASRLKCIASFSVIAQYWNVPFYVYWGPSISFEDISWSSLFELPNVSIEWLGKREWNHLRSDTTQTTIHLDKILSYLKNDYKYPFANIESLFQRRKIPKVTAECNREMSMFNSNVLHKYIPKFKQRMIKVWTEFVPCTAVREIVCNEVYEWKKVGAKHVLGIHIRKNEAVFSQLGNRYKKPNDSEIEEMISQQLAQNDNQERLHQVFVATDDPHTATTINTKFGSNINVRMFQWKRYPQRVNTVVHGQQKALADLYVLRCCDEVQGTQFSVFTQLAKYPICRHSGMHVYLPDPENVHGLSPEEWDKEPEPTHLIQERKKKAQEKRKQIQKIASKLVTDSMKTAIKTIVVRGKARRIPNDTKKKTNSSNANSTTKAVSKNKTNKSITQVGVHVTIIGRSQNEFLGRRGVTLGLQKDSSILVCVDADRGTIISVKQDDIISC